MSISFDREPSNFAKIKVIGVGGGGSNAVNRMVSYGIQDVEYIVVNTDKQALYLSNAPHKIQIGEKLTRGLGSGGNPEVGRKAAEESKSELEEAIKGADLLFIAVGLGGGTGTGAAPVIANIARTNQVLTVAFATTPFNFEGKPRRKEAEKGYEELKNEADSIAIIPNQKLIELASKNTPLKDSFKMADEALRQGIQGITDLIAKPAIINLDFADVRSVLMERGNVHMGVGIGYGDNKVLDAAKQAIESPLLNTNINGAKGIICNITMDSTVGLGEITEATDLIESAAHPDANVFFGADVDPNMKDEVRITIIATGFSDNDNNNGNAERKSTYQNPAKKESDSDAIKETKLKQPAQPAQQPVAPRKPLNTKVQSSYDDSDDFTPDFATIEPRRRIQSPKKFGE